MKTGSGILLMGAAPLEARHNSSPAGTKGVLDPHHVFAVDREHVEARDVVGAAVPLQPRAGRAHQVATLPSRDRLGRAPEARVAPQLDLREHHHAPRARYQVDVVSMESVALFDHAVAIAAQDL